MFDYLEDFFSNPVSWGALVFFIIAVPLFIKLIFGPSERHTNKDGSYDMRFNSEKRRRRSK